LGTPAPNGVLTTIWLVVIDRVNKVFQILTIVTKLYVSSPYITQINYLKLECKKIPCKLNSAHKTQILEAD